jgi:uncharacterized cupin superfamily protein
MAALRSFNLHAPAFHYDPEDPDGYHAGMVRFGPQIGAETLGGSVYELPPGQSLCPYHYEYADEEWLVVLEGRPTVRHPDGEDVLGPGDVVAFVRGPAGAHKVSNPGTQPVRVLMISTRIDPAVVVYPDSGKIAVFGGAHNEDDVIVRRESAVDYWDGER